MSLGGSSRAKTGVIVAVTALAVVAIVAFVVRSREGDGVRPSVNSPAGDGTADHPSRPPGAAGPGEASPPSYEPAATLATCDGAPCAPELLLVALGAAGARPCRAERLASCLPEDGAVVLGTMGPGAVWEGVVSAGRVNLSPGTSALEIRGAEVADGVGDDCKQYVLLRRVQRWEVVLSYPECVNGAARWSRLPSGAWAVLPTGPESFSLVGPVTLLPGEDAVVNLPDEPDQFRALRVQGIDFSSAMLVVRRGLMWTSYGPWYNGPSPTQFPVAPDADLLAVLAPEGACLTSPAEVGDEWLCQPGDIELPDILVEFPGMPW